jgi:hypothetical protein
VLSFHKYYPKIKSNFTPYIIFSPINSRSKQHYVIAIMARLFFPLDEMLENTCFRHNIGIQLSIQMKSINTYDLVYSGNIRLMCTYNLILSTFIPM